LKNQLTLAGSDFERYRKPTRREKFLAEINTKVGDTGDSGDRPPILGNDDRKCRR
jgi:hypothetical protein